MPRSLRRTALRLLGSPARWWWGSLPLRVVVSSVLGSVIVLVLGGFLLLQQATAGVVSAKKQSAVAESLVALDTLQGSLDSSAVTADSLTNRLLDLAIEAATRGTQGGQYQVIVRGPVSDLTSGSVAASSVPDALRRAVIDTDGIYVTSTLIVYRSGQPSEPGVVVGADLDVPGTGRYPIYFIFPMAREIETLQVLQQAVVSTGLVLLIGVALMSYLLARQVVRPVRAARLAAEQLSSGRLEGRMKVHGTDDLARLAQSMNDMAAELQRQIGQLEDLSRVQQQFVSDVSHELRTPLTTVRMAGELLFEGRDEFDPMVRRSAEILHDELDRFEALLADLLEISRFDAGAALLTVEETDLEELVRSEVEAQRPFADHMETPVHIYAQDDCVAEVDSRRIRRIMRNLITNAIEHGEKRPIDIALAADADAVAIVVRDHGVGFRANQAQQVFSRFWRADPARARTVGGTGLGLAIALEDARLHGGWLNAWGRPYLGAQFRLTVPRRNGEVLASSPLPVVPRDLDQSPLGPGPVMPAVSASAGTPRTGSEGDE